MDTDTAITLSALKFVSGDVVHVCRLCFSSTEKDEISIDDCVKLERPYYNDSISFLDMFNELGVTVEQQLPNALCLDCAATTINSYLFQKLCQISTEKWTDALSRLEKGLTDSESINTNVQTAYILIDKKESIMITSHKKYTVKNKKSVLSKLKNILVARKTKPKIKTIICEECGVRCRTTARTKHMESHNKEVKSKFPCPQCAKYFGSELKLKEHAERVHYPKVVQCSQCAQMFGTERMVRRHEKIHHTAAICKLCFVQFPSKNALRAHLDKHDILECPQCNKNFLNRQTYKLHLKICGKSEKDPNFFCDICSKGYVRKNGLRTHLKINHGFGRVHSCSWCGKKFDAISKLKNHIVKHTRERNFYCEHCGGKFVTQAALVYHIRLHTGEKPFPCDLCDESFLSASRRMEHKRRKHFGPTQECHVCHVKFVTSHQLRKHVERHYNPHSKLYAPETKPIGTLLPCLQDVENITLV